MIDTVKELGKRWSQRKIARELGLHRQTVRRHLAEDPKCTIPTAGDSGDDKSKCTIPTAGSAGRKSLCAEFDELIKEKLKDGLSAQRIFQDLREGTGFRGSYESVKRFARKLERDSELPFRRMEVLAGEECQVDYGTGARILGADGKHRKTHLLRVVLSCSRKAYSEVSFTQETECFLRALENAFRHFGGVPKTVVIDNLKAGVIKSCVYDPELNPKLRDFAAHYGTCIMPSRVRTPRHKGKVERQVGYAQDNALKGRSFGSLAAQNAHLRDWERKVADQRIHGTTRRQVARMFSEEKPHLAALPPDLFPVFREERRKVHRDGHIEVAKAYYSVPPEYTRREVWVRFDARTVRVFNHRMEQVALHARQEPGRFSTCREHIPEEKIGNPERGNEWLLGRADRIGAQAGAWARAMLENRGIPGTRVLNGLLALEGRHPAAVVERACGQALDAGEFGLKGLKAYIVQTLEHEQQQFDFLEKHALIRDLDEYAQTLHIQGIFQ